MVAISKSLITGCWERHCSKPHFLHEVLAHFDEHILSPSCNGNSHHESEHKIILTSPYLSSDPASGNCGSADRAMVAFILVLNWTYYPWERSCPSHSPLSLPLFFSFKWCSHLKSGFLLQHGHSCSHDTFKPLPPECRLPFNCCLIFAISIPTIFLKLLIGKDCLMFITRSKTIFLDKEECWQETCYHHFLCKLQWVKLVGWWKRVRVLIPAHIW